MDTCNLFFNDIGIVPWFNEEDGMYHVVNIDGDILLSSFDCDECYDYIDSLIGGDNDA